MSKINYLKWDVLMWYIRKILFYMRLTTVIILALVVQLSAADGSFAQRLNYNKKNTTIKELFREIKRQMDYNVVWYEDRLASDMPLEAKFKNASIKQVLKVALHGTPVNYEIIDNNIIIKEEEETLIDGVLEFFSNIDVRGRVVDENNGPLVGAVVKIKGAITATVTNANGEFGVKNVGENEILVISFVGYERREIKAAERLGDIKLIPSNDKLQEVIINAGYYTVSERERTGAISKITSKEIENQPVNNVLQAMQANIPGVQVIQSTGMPGGGFTVQIRGQNSLKQGNQPFYIIDGVPFLAVPIGGSRDGTFTTRESSPLTSINPNDIESIEVLKDADATAIYGSRGANGIILITTKKGKIGKAKASFSASQGIARVGKKLDLMNTAQYLDMRREAMANDKVAASATDYDINGTWDQNRYTDWQKELIGRNAPTTNIQTSFSGGASNITYLIGGGYYREGTVFPGESSFGRNSGNFSIQYVSDNKKFNAAFDANYSQVDNSLISTDLTQFIKLVPNYPALLDERGELNWANNTMYSNPIAITRQPYDTKTTNLLANAKLSYSIIRDLKVKASIGYTIMNRNETSQLPLSTYSPILNLNSESRVSYFTNNSANSWIVEGQADWIKKIGTGKLSMLLGMTLQQSLREGQEIRGSGFTSDALMGNIASASLFSISQRSYLQYRYAALYGRLNYALLDKYIINMTVRRDGSSRFGTNKQFANFGAVGAAWILSEEGFVKDQLPFISFAKLRGSYGITGNDNIPDYGYLNLWRTNTNTYQGAATIIPQQLANPNYAWEVNKKAEAAFEIGFFKNRINLSTSYYSNRSSSQLVFQTISPSTGFGAITDNLPATVGNTGWEFDLRTTNISARSFNWSTSFNLTIPRNKLISYPGIESSGDNNLYVIGKSLSIFKSYHTSLDSQTGLYTIEDYDKNGVFDSRDMYVIISRGRKFYGGLQNSLSYKGIALDFLLQFVKQTGEGGFNSFTTPGRFVVLNPVDNQLNALGNHWQNPGDVSILQKFSTSTTATASYTNSTTRGSQAFGDNSFIRLKSISLSYSLPVKLIQRLKLNDFRFFVQGQNVFTITRYKGLDPEIQRPNNLPSLQVYTAGLQITL
ncbi:SusC/RagA family TonB-linked outer membrane protein [Pedobacter nyackensis]|uniref:TonB-linked outer membrane protein, SusC/RagA family n=1 Tax=Pedobacter nyackensis TaxID=475255 RepID=A0A1W2DL16_9SPHI|nr:SusC/RagA family TonB-linked outer membrane protein [Pedobacter nyackensis]SMC98190.1 TonB-linked outer membrane protein, SusC/RagA family [Pedobacter nyackensis]